MFKFPPGEQSGIALGNVTSNTFNSSCDAATGQADMNLAWLVRFGRTSHARSDALPLVA